MPPQGADHRRAGPQLDERLVARGKQGGRTTGQQHAVEHLP
jgi:hypothetical protein